MEARPSSELIGEQVARFRLRRGWTQQDLADSVKEHGGALGRGAVAKIESGVRQVSLDELVLLAAVLNVTPVALLIPSFERDQPLRVGNQELDHGTARAWMLGSRQLREEPVYLDSSGPWSTWPITYSDDREDRGPYLDRDTVAEIVEAVARRLEQGEE